MKPDISERTVAQGVIISKIACNNERRMAAKRLNKDISEIPLKFGSMRIAVNLINIAGQTFNVSKAPQTEFAKEERLILEISYRFDYKNNSTEIIEDHSVVREMNMGDAVELTIDHLFTSKNHVMKVINPVEGEAIRSFFIKTWADRIVFLDAPCMTPGTNVISPIDVVRNVSPTLQLTLV